METLVVNLFGVPGSGKSTGAAYVFAQLKMKGINAELVTEYAKDKVWEENSEVFRNQAYLFGKQSYRLSRLDGKVDVIVTDSPLPLSILYNDDSRLTESFNQSVMDVFNSYRNLNFLLTRTKPYNPAGRRQTEEESNALTEPILKMLESRNINYQYADGNSEGYDCIVDVIMSALAPKTEEEKTLTAAQAIRYNNIMCHECSCNSCSQGKWAAEIGECCGDLEARHPEKVVSIIQKWAIENGYLTENLKETGKFNG